VDLRGARGNPKVKASSSVSSPMLRHFGGPSAHLRVIPPSRGAIPNMDKDRTPNISKNTIAINITKEKNNALDTCPSFQSMENSIQSNLNHTSPSAIK